MCTGKEDSSFVSRASSKESWITFLILEWSLDDFECQEGHISTGSCVQNFMSLGALNEEIFIISKNGTPSDIKRHDRIIASQVKINDIQQILRFDKCCKNALKIIYCRKSSFI